ncbi:Serine-threonine kinase receptor-associated protein [Mycena sanguinolenta]|uniref:Serine-threonine kinase receptor-associated protein n=1 Tax=Mycena sanguinolenta TaxID=230812 RepID=A0A8H6YE94_9AGAR|nr:Serine-threonine kinase receptor-associated protein [Mycena sanguinolenta]
MSSSPSHHRSPSASSRTSNSHEPTQTHHHSILPTILPTPAVVESVAGGAHYSGSNVEQPESPLKHRHSSHDRSTSHTDLKVIHERVLADIRSLYELRPSPEIFKRTWAPDAVFEGPPRQVQGLPRWYAMPKLFAKSETVNTRVMSSTASPNRIVFAQTQRYKNRFMDKTISSVVTVDLDESDKIVCLMEQWDGKALPNHFVAYFSPAPVYN